MRLDYLFLSVANDYKVAEAAESINWASVKTKYSDIFNPFVADLPDDDSSVLKDSLICLLAACLPLASHR